MMLIILFGQFQYDVFLRFVRNKHKVIEFVSVSYKNVFFHFADLETNTRSIHEIEIGKKIHKICNYL